MKSRIKKILIGIICLAGVSAFMTLPAQAQNEERVLSSAQQWVTGIEVPGLGYRSWVTGIQPPSTVEVAEEVAGIDALVDKIMTPINAVIYNAVFFSVPFLGSDLKLVVVWLVVGAVFCIFRFSQFSRLRLHKHLGWYEETTPIQRIMEKFHTFKHWLPRFQERLVLATSAQCLF